jgi:carboxymethylenebutenolidase
MTTFDSGGKHISVELFLPAMAGLHPAIVVAYGTEGLGVILDHDAGAAIRDFARHLATEGFVALIPHFFERTSTPEGFQTVIPAYDAPHRDEWLDTLGDCLKFAVSRTTEVDKNRLGLLGFSLGGHLALRRAKIGTSRAIRAVVEFFAPISSPPFSGLGDHLGDLPPVQIHHGASDQIVPNTQSDELERLLVAAGKVKGVDYERHNYPGEGHGFRGAAAIKASKRSTADFFKKHLA